MLFSTFTWPPTNEEKLPAAVALIARKEPGQEHVFCSGVPIRHDLVLTAAHCIDQFKKYWPDYALAVRTSARVKSSFEVKRWFIHPHFRQKTTSHALDVDVALLKLEGMLPPAQNDADERPDVFRKKARTMWMKGYSPVRLKTDSAEMTMSSANSWNELQFERELIQEGKYRMRAVIHSSAPCAGDSGAPLWSFDNQSRELQAVVVQGNCNGGSANAVPIQSLSNWVQNTLLTLNEYRSAGQELWKIFPHRLFANDHN